MTESYTEKERLCNVKKNEQLIEWGKRGNILIKNYKI